VQVQGRAARREDTVLRQLRRGVLLLRCGLGTRQLQDLPLRLGVRIVDAHVQQEAVELRLRQRVGAFLLDGVLRRHDQEQPRQRIGLAAPTVTCRSAMASSRADCTLAGARLTSSASTRLWNTGPWVELEAALLGPVDIGAGDVAGQQVRRELDAVEVALERIAKGFDRAGLGEPGRALDEQVAVGEQRDEQALDEVRLADLRYTPGPVCHCFNGRGWPMAWETLKQALLADIAALIDRRADAAHRADLHRLASSFFTRFSSEDMRSRSAENLYGLLYGLLRFLQDWSGDAVKLRLFNPQVGSHGWESKATVITILCRDMPFCTASVRGEINRRDIGIHCLASCNLRAHRDDRGCLQELLEDSAGGDDVSSESLMFFEITRHSAWKTSTSWLAR
jgi:hypothetical protein